MFTKLFKAMLPIVAIAFMSISMISCSDDEEEEPQLTLSVESNEIVSFLPEGLVTAKISLSNPNAQLSKSHFSIDDYSFTGMSGSFISDKIQIAITDLIKTEQGYFLQLSYDLMNNKSGNAKITISYDGKPVTGTINLKMVRSHLYPERIIFHGDINDIEKFSFPVYKFLDQLNIEHMDYKAIGKKDEIFFAKGNKKFYPAMVENETEPYFKNSGSSSDGMLFLMGLTNGYRRHVFSVLNKIKLKEPDQYGNPYIWLEFEFVVMPNE